jgi:cytochrome c biogenesis protein CcdA
LELGLQRDDFSVHFHDISQPEHYQHWIQLTELENITKNTPITLVGNTIIQGFDSAITTGRRIEQLIDQSMGKETMTFEEYIAAGGSGKVESVVAGTCDEEEGVCTIQDTSYLIRIPFWGVVDMRAYSLPALSMLLGFIDGFNPCAMWVLVTFLVVLTHAGSRQKMFQIAGLFIIAEAIMYYLILNIWMTTWNFVRLDQFITPIVGLIAIGGGVFFLYEWKTADGTCKVTNSKQKAKITQKIRSLVDAEMTILTILGVIGLALSVNIIEFACSIGIPQAYTKILDLNPLSWSWQQFYMGLYILFYMIDDVVIFGIALYSLDKIGITTKYSKIANFVGGILMILLGFILIFDPQLLIF